LAVPGLLESTPDESAIVFAEWLPFLVVDVEQVAVGVGAVVVEVGDIPRYCCQGLLEVHMTSLVVNLATLLHSGTTSVSGLIMHQIQCACHLDTSSDLGGGLKPNC
jgi:hypothetical protein